MCLFIESIKVRDGVAFNLPLHQKRMDKTRRDRCGQSDTIRLEEVVKVPEQYRKGLIKCRVLYGQTIHQLAFTAYSLPTIHSLSMIHDDHLDYAYKSSDRHQIENHYNKRGDADDILVIKNGLLTDTSFCNVVLRKGKAYFTPDSFLLNGVKRQQLLLEGRITEQRVRMEDLRDCDAIHLINAMIDLEDDLQVPISRVM